MGLIQEIDQIQEDVNPEDIVSPQQFNLIQVFEEILNFKYKINNSKLSHLSILPKDILKNLLEYSKVFYSSMKSLVQTNRVRPHI